MYPFKEENTMREKKLIIYGIPLIMFSLIIIAINYFHQDKTIHLNNALKIAYDKAISWNSNAELITMTSVDNPDINDKENGYDGKRRYWNFQFGVPNTENMLILTIHDMHIISSSPAKGFVNKKKIISQDKIKLNSSDVIKKCKEYYEIKPGKNWAAGYHYTLNKDGDDIIISLICSDIRGYFTKISFNATSGKLISALHKIESGGGLFNEQGKVNLCNKAISILNTSISQNFQKDNSLIVLYIVNPLKTDMSLAASITNDSGNNWKTLNIKDNFIKVFFSDSYSYNNTLYAITSEGLDTSKNSGTTWNRIFSSDLPIDDVCSRNKSVLILANNQLHISNDEGETWKDINCPEDSKFAQLDSYGNIFICTKNKFLKKVDNSWVQINCPIKDDIIGFQIIQNNAVIFSTKNIAIFSKNTSWKFVNNCSGIKNVILDPFSQDNNKVYSLLIDGTVNRLTQNDKSNYWISKKINVVGNGTIIGLLPYSKDKLYFCMESNIKWEEIKRRN